MPGYQLVEAVTLQPAKRDGIASLPTELGLLDFLRELAAEECPFPKFAELRVVGLEEVLHAARPEEADLALEIHRRLRAAASDLEQQLVSVQVVFTGKLVRGDALWCEYRGSRLPVGHIFGSPIEEHDARGNGFFPTNFNLTHA
jgi:hypothetical protein